MALEKARAHIERMYRGTLTIYGWELIEDPDTHISREQEVLKLEDQPCLLSHTSTSPATTAEGVPSVVKSTKIFVAPEINIPEGSRLVVTQDGVTNTYERSGAPAFYPTHQEITVNVMKKVNASESTV